MHLSKGSIGRHMLTHNVKIKVFAVLVLEVSQKKRFHWP